MKKKRKDVMWDHLSQLIGLSVADVVTMAGSEAEFGEKAYGLRFEPNDAGVNYIAWIMQDPEGNGPVFLDIEHDGD
jgi:hypothetical protein